MHPEKRCHLEGRIPFSVDAAFSDGHISYAMDTKCIPISSELQTFALTADYKLDVSSPLIAAHVTSIQLFIFFLLSRTGSADLPLQPPLPACPKGEENHNGNRSKYHHFTLIIDSSS